MQYRVIDAVEIAPAWVFWRSGLVGLLTVSICIVLSVRSAFRSTHRAHGLQGALAQPATMWLVLIVPYFAVGSVAGTVLFVQSSVILGLFLGIDWKAIAAADCVPRRRVLGTPYASRTAWKAPAYLHGTTITTYGACGGQLYS